MKLLWHTVEILLLVFGYIWCWTLAFAWVNEADTLSYVIGSGLAVVLLATLVAVGREVWRRTKTHLPKGIL